MESGRGYEFLRAASNASSTLDDLLAQAEAQLDVNELETAEPGQNLQASLVRVEPHSLVRIEPHSLVRVESSGPVCLPASEMQLDRTLGTAGTNALDTPAESHDGKVAEIFPASIGTSTSGAASRMSSSWAQDRRVVESGLSSSRAHALSLALAVSFARRSLFLARAHIFISHAYVHVGAGALDGPSALIMLSLSLARAFRLSLARPPAVSV